MNRQLAVVVATLFFLILNAGCECDAETDRQLCAERQCGSATLVDRCGDSRDVQCGSCQGYEECAQNTCICEPETNEELCQSVGANCGTLMITDGCSEERQVHCGQCPDIGECGDNQCRCDDESSEKLCADNSLDCGPTSVVDSCGITQSIECGDCTAPDECTENICVCDGESEAQICAQKEGACGLVEVSDSCEVIRQVQCEPCAFGDAIFGAVRDGDTGALVEDALIRIYKWPPPGGENFSWAWPANYRADSPDFATGTGVASSSATGDINFEFTSGEPICFDGVESTALPPHKWYRIRVDRPGYQPRTFYRYLDGYRSADCPVACPASEDSSCHRFDFEIFPDATDHPLYPELTVDVRDLGDHHWQCAELPDDAQYEHIIGLRVSAGVANVGPGPFHLEGTAGDEDDEKGVVYQHIKWSDGSTELRDIESDFFDYHHPSARTRFISWVRLGFVEPVDECLDPQDRPDQCLSHDSEKISFCLHDSDPFDEDVMNAHDGVASQFTDPPTCIEGYNQGITSGWKDTYGSHLPAQAIIIGTPAEAAVLGSRWIEIEVDPRQVLYEGNRDGNISRLLVDVPPDAADLCDDPETLLDCTVPASEYSTEQRWQCPGYLDF